MNSEYVISSPSSPDIRAGTKKIGDEGAGDDPREPATQAAHATRAAFTVAVAGPSLALGLPRSTLGLRLGLRPVLPAATRRGRRRRRRQLVHVPMLRPHAPLARSLAKPSPTVSTAVTRPIGAPAEAAMSSPGIHPRRFGSPYRVRRGETVFADRLQRDGDSDLDLPVLAGAGVARRARRRPRSPRLRPVSQARRPADRTTGLAGPRSSSQPGGAGRRRGRAFIRGDGGLTVP